jgi:hypothetical protein
VALSSVGGAAALRQGATPGAIASASAGAAAPPQRNAPPKETSSAGATAPAERASEHALPSSSQPPFAGGRPEVQPPTSPELVPPEARAQESTGMAACYALVTDPRHSAFLSTLLLRPVGRWYNVAELCTTSQVAAPATLPPQPLFCCWLPHPWADPTMAAIVFLSLRDGSNTVALCRRTTW